MNVLLDVQDLKKYYTVTSGTIFKKQTRTIRAVDGVSLSLRENETLGLVGESGCGKSTTGNLLIRLIEPTDGTITYRGTTISKLTDTQLIPYRKKIQMIFQDPYASLDPMMSLGEIVAEPWEIHGEYSVQERRKEADHLLSLVGLEGDYAKRYPHELSGGQRQRVAIARALALHPELIIADEPTSALDVSVKAQIINLLRNLRDELGLAMIFISHDLGVIRYVSDRLIVMYLGKVMESGPTKNLFNAPQHPYTRALLDAIPSPDPTKRRPHSLLKGEVQSQDNLLGICPFFPRCPCRGPLCETVNPPLVEVEPGHQVACLYPTVKEAYSC